jgi:hypothetical protein
LAVTRAEWVAFLDQDDIWTPDKLAGQDALIRADRDDWLGLLYGRAQRFDETGPTGRFDLWFGSGTLPEGEIRDALLARPSFIPNSSVVFRRSAPVRLPPMPSSVHFCTDYYLCVMIAGDRTAACPQTLCCHYRVHASSMTQVFRREVHEEILLIMELAARPSHRHIPRIRRRVHETWIGVAEFPGRRTLARHPGHHPARLAGLSRVAPVGSGFAPVARPYPSSSRCPYWKSLPERCRARAP